MDSTIIPLNNWGQINHCQLDKYDQNLLSYPVDSDVSNGQWYPPFEQLGPGVQIFLKDYTSLEILIILYVSSCYSAC